MKDEHLITTIKDLVRSSGRFYPSSSGELEDQDAVVAILEKQKLVANGQEELQQVVTVTTGIPMNKETVAVL